MKCLNVRFMLHVLLSCVITLFQMFITVVKLREKRHFILETLVHGVFLDNLLQDHQVNTGYVGYIRD